jgi:spermidine/putrescine transport system permease protein
VQKYIFTFSAALVALLFLYFPLFIIIFYSFNAESVNAFPIHSYSLKWYQIMFQDGPLLSSLLSSVMVAIIATGIALIIGLPASYAIHKYNFPGKKLMERIILMPITLPGIVTGVAMLSFLPFMGFMPSLKSVTVGHITFLIAIVNHAIGRTLQTIRSFFRAGFFRFRCYAGNYFFQGYHSQH